MLVKTLIILCAVTLSVTEQCYDVGPYRVMYDPTCARGGVGCNAGGQGQNCRFCGMKHVWPACHHIRPTTHRTVYTTTVLTTDTTTPIAETSSIRVFETPIKLRTVNNCPFTVWPAMQGKSKSQPDWKLPNKGGWELKSNQNSTVSVPNDFTAGRIWVRTGCQTINGKFVCETGDCGPFVQCAHDDLQRDGLSPVTLVEFNLGEKDSYDINLEQGFNVKVQIKPSNSAAGCGLPKCDKDLIHICPEDLKIRNAAKEVIGCTSACQRWRTDEYCCRNLYASAETCRSSDWPVDYAAVFKQACPEAYIYPFDKDNFNRVFTCKETNFDVIFC